MVHIWHEDSDNSATTQFWNFLKKTRVCYNMSFAEIRGFSGNQNLFDFTGSLKGDFIITKKHLGSCWACTCCDKYTKDLVKKCSHAGNKKTDKEKALNLYHNTLARTYL